MCVCVCVSLSQRRKTANSYNSDTQKKKKCRLPVLEDYPQLRGFTFKVHCKVRGKVAKGKKKKNSVVLLVACFCNKGKGTATLSDG